MWTSEISGLLCSIHIPFSYQKLFRSRSYKHMSFGTWPAHFRIMLSTDSEDHETAKKNIQTGSGLGCPVNDTQVFSQVTRTTVTLVSADYQWFTMCSDSDNEHSRRNRRWMSSMAFSRLSDSLPRTSSCPNVSCAHDQKICRRLNGF